ncbi:MAG: RtcB family protein [Fibrobacterota bacterium]
MKIHSHGSLKIWGGPFEPGAMAQLEQLASMPYLYAHVCAMPDAHIGIGATIGSVFATVNAVVPSAVGVDIGCGMRAVRTDLPADAAMKDRLQRFIDTVYARVPVGFESHGSNREWAGMENFPLNDSALRKKAAQQLGTLGGGNHFVEVQGDGERLWLMIHTGSRHIGLQIAEKYIHAAKQMNLQQGHDLPPDLSFLPVGTALGGEYLDAMDWALDYAKENRRQLMEDLLDIFRETVTPSFAVTDDIEINHNFAAFETHFGKRVLVHRKGAVRAFKGEPGIIPGSMGAPSYITRGRGNPDSFMSSSHGAGRCMGRREAQKSIRMDAFEQAMKGVTANLSHRMLDEAPQAYKDIDAVMAAQSDLVEIVYRLMPLASVKG